MIAPPEEGVVEHFLDSREPVGGHRRQLEVLQAEAAIVGAIWRQLFVAPAEGVGQGSVVLAAVAADQGQEVAAVLVLPDGRAHLEIGQQPMKDDLLRKPKLTLLTPCQFVP